jgi:hypothetical protein
MAKPVSQNFARTAEINLEETFDVGDAYFAFVPLDQPALLRN